MACWRNLIFTVLCVVTAGCQSGSPSDDLNLAVNSSAVGVIASIGKAVQKCWFKSGDAAFRSYRMANEINSYAGRPRLLLVPKNNPGGLPSLVIQAEQSSGNNRSKVQVFGPLLATSSGGRIAGDVRRWSNNNTLCKA